MTLNRTLLAFFTKRRGKNLRRREDLSSEESRCGESNVPLSTVKGGDSTESSETQKRVFSLAVLAILLSTTALMMVGFKGPAPLTSQMVVVDMTQLFRLKAAALVGDKGFDPNDDTSRLKVVEQAQEIRSLIEKYASDRGVIVVAKGAVFTSTLEEVTDDISKLL